MTDDGRGPDGLWREGHSGSPQTMFKAGDSDNPRARQKRERDARGKPANAKQELKYEKMRAELVALDVLERLLSPSRAMTAPRLPRLPRGSNARREAERLAMRSITRALRTMQRIARDPSEPPELRLEMAGALLERGGAHLANGILRGAQGGAEGKEKKEPKVIVVHNPVPRPPKAAETAESDPAQPSTPLLPPAAEAAAPLKAPPPAAPRKPPWQIAQERHAEAVRRYQEQQPEPARPKRPRQAFAIDE